VPVHAAIARAIFIRAVASVPVRVVFPDGRVLGNGGKDAPVMRLVRPGAFFARLGADVKIGFGEAYMAGDWTTGPGTDLADLLAPFAARMSRLVHPLLQRLRHVVERTQPEHEENTPENSPGNIARHYDLSNELFESFLDETMTYSSAWFEDGDDLAAAQRRKIDGILDLARVRPGMHVLEIGSGWGGFALHAAAELGCRVTTITISKAQHDLATQRVRDAGLADRVSIELRDYRELSGTYDAIVSIEMLEAVGAEFFATFFAACDRALAPGGKMSLQTITLPDVGYEPQRRGVNWIQAYIFPGGLLPSLAAIEASLHGTQLVVRSVEDIAPHYVRTLATWRTRFMARLDDVRAMGFDERFIRMWEYYLTISEAGFDTGVCQDYQIVFEKGRALPSREMAASLR
jgi:cyclopropane-fatty-acyl-phospholipid synthase